MDDISTLVPANPALAALAVLTFAVGCGLLALAGRELRKARELVSSGRRVPARVTEIRQSGAGGRRLLRPVYELIGEDGRPYVVVSSTASSSVRCNVGDTVGMLHPPGRPAEAVRDGAFELWGPPAALAILGLSAWLFTAGCLYGLLQGG